jgi:hypothetical protein
MLTQIAATLIATLVAHQALNAAGEWLLDERMLNVVLVPVFTTAMFGPVLNRRVRIAHGSGTTGLLDRTPGSRT